jgi:tetratricopeptide (TPR) repeat protein
MYGGSINSVCLSVILAGLVYAPDAMLCAQVITATDESEVTEEEVQARVAYERFLSMLRRQPRPGTALDRVTEFHRDRGTLENFVHSLSEQTSSPQDQGVSWMLIGLIEHQRMHDSEAASAFREAEARRPDEPLASWYLGQSLMRLGQATTAAEALERAIQKSPNKTDLLQIFQELGRAYRRSPQPEKAADIWRRMEELFPNDLRVKEQIASALEEEQDFESANIRFSELATLHRDLDRAAQFALKAGELKLKLGRTEEALGDFEKQLSKLDPDSWLFRETRHRIEDVFLRDDDLVGLVSYYEGWLKSHPEDLNAMSSIGRALANLGQSTEARGWYAKALAVAPSSVALREAMIEQLIREENFTEAITQHEQLRRFDNGNPDHIETWGQLFLNRRDLPIDERRSRAVSIWKMLLNDRPNDAGTVVRVAELLRRAELTDEAVDLYRQAVSLAPRDPQYREYLGKCLYFLKRTDEAIAAWNSIAEGESRTTENLVRLAQVLQNHGEKSRALDAMKDACALTPEFADRIRYSEMLREFEADGRHPFAEESLQQLDMAEVMAESSEDHQRVLNERIRSLTASGLLEQKTQILAAELQKSTNATATRWQTLALYYDAANQLPLAIESIRRSLAIEPESVTSWTVAADLYEKTGRNADATDAIRRLVTLDHRSRAEYLKRIATLEQKLGRFKAAQQAGKDLIALAPGNPEHLQFYADLCFQAGQKEDGLAALRRAVRSNASDEDALLSLAQALQNQLETTEAIDLYWRAFESTSDPDTRISVITSLAELHLRTNQFDRLVQKLELRGRVPDKQRDSALSLATAFRIAGDLQSSRRQLEGLLTADSRDVSLLSELSKLTEEEGDLDVAASYQRRICSVAPSEEGKLRLSGLLQKLGDFDEADEFWTRICETDAESHDVIQAIDQLISMESMNSLNQTCERILQREPENWETLVRLGYLELRTGNRRRAAKLFDKLLSLQLDPDTPSASGMSNPTKLTTFGGLGSSSSKVAWPPALSRGETVLAVVSLLEESVDSNYGSRDGSRNGHSSSGDRSWSGDQIARLMPNDYGEARIFCLAARLLKARDEGRIKEVLAQLEAAADSSLQSAWDVLHAHKLSAVIDKELWQDERLELQKTLQHLARLARTNAADGQLLFLLTCEDALKSGRFDKETEPNNSPKSGGAGAGTPLLTFDQVDLFVKSFESVLALHPTWLAELDHSTLLTACRQNGIIESIDSLVGRLTQEQCSHWQLEAALNLALLRGNIATEDALKRLDRIVLLARQIHVPNSGMDETLSRWMRTLDQIARQSAAKRDLESVFKTLDWWLTFKAADQIRVNPIIAPAQVLAAAQEVVMRTIGMDEDVGRGVLISDPRSMTQRRLTTHRISVDEFRYLSEIDTSFFQSGRHDELLNWCRERRVGADARTVLCLDLIQALFCMEHDYVPEAVVHLIRAVEKAPEDVLLRLCLVELTESLGQKADALALLDQLPDSDPALLKAREIKSLDLALKINDMGRARLAAERLYGLQLDPLSQEFLGSKLSRLGLRDMAAQIKESSRPVTLAAQSLSPLELLERYEKQGNEQAAVQIAQQLIRRTSSLTVAPSSRFSGRQDQERVRARAFHVLRKSGELEKLIERQMAQLAKSPNSKVLLQTLAEYLDEAGRANEAATVRASMISRDSGDSADALIRVAGQLAEVGHKGEACDTYLKLLQKHPHAFGELYDDDIEEFLVAENRLGEIADTVIHRRYENAKATLPAHVLHSMADRLSHKSASLPVAAALLEQSLTAYPNQALSVLDSIRNLDVWQSPEMFAVLSELYLPAADDLAEGPRLGWPTQSLEVEPAELDADPSVPAGGDLGILFHALSSPERRVEFQERLLASQKVHPEWRGADMLLALVELKSEDGEKAAEQRIRQWISEPGQTIPEAVARNVASLLSAHTHHKSLAIELLQTSVSQNQPKEIDFSRSDVRLLNRLFVETNQLSRGREFILTHLPEVSVIEQGQSGLSIQSIISRLEAANTLIALRSPLDALRVVNGLTTEDLQRYAEHAPTFEYGAFGRRPTRDRAKLLRSAATRILTPLDIAEGLEQSRGQTDSAAGPLMDLDLELIRFQGPVDELESATLKSLSKSPNGSSSNAVLQRLADSMKSAMQQVSTDPSLIIVGGFFVLTSRDDKVMVQVVPALEQYLSRSLPQQSSPEFLRREKVQMGFACLAFLVSDQPGLEPLVKQMLDRSIAIARQSPDPRYLFALLYKRGETLNAMGDRPAAEEAWSELLNLILAEPDHLAASKDSGVEASVPRRPNVDIGAELRKNLLKLSP